MRRIVIMGAAGRDFHNFNVRYRNDPQSEVVAFTAAQIPFIADRTYPTELAGPRYPGGIPIYPEEDLDTLLSERHIDASASTPAQALTRAVDGIVRLLTHPGDAARQGARASRLVDGAGAARVARHLEALAASSPRRERRHVA